MSKCIICYKNFVEKVKFKTLFDPYPVCYDCQNNLFSIESKCRYCSHPLGYNCCDKDIYNNSLFIENKFLKDILYQVKALELYEKLIIFKPYLEKIGKQHKNYSIIIVPLNTSNTRKHNQVYILATFLKLKIEDCLIRTDNTTHSLKNKYERINNPPIFKLKYLPKNNNLILLDDIFTTGSTIKAITKLFPSNYYIKIYTIQRTLIK